MEYFNQLLESYSKLKNRKLKLLEDTKVDEPKLKVKPKSDKEHLRAIQQAKEELIKRHKKLANKATERVEPVPIHGDAETYGSLGIAKSGNRFFHSDTPGKHFQLPDDTKHRGWSDAVDKIKSLTTPSKKPVEKEIKPEEKQLKGQPKTQQEPKVQEPQTEEPQIVPQQVLDFQTSPLTTFFPEDAQKISTEFAEVSQHIASNWDKLPKSIQDSLGGSPEIATALVQGGPESLDSATAKASIVVKPRGSKRFNSIQVNTDPDVTYAVVKRVKQIFEFSTQKELTDSQKLKLQQSIYYTGDGDVVILGIGGSGIRYPASTPGLPQLIKHVTNKHGIKIARRKISDPDTQVLDRSLFCELIPAMHGLRGSDAKTLGQTILRSIARRLASINAGLGIYDSMKNIPKVVFDGQEDAFEQIEGMLKLMKDPESRRRVFSLAMKSISVRKPFFSIPAGLTVGDGRRQDHIEITSEKKLRRYLERSGALTPDEIEEFFKVPLTDKDLDSLFSHDGKTARMQGSRFIPKMKSAIAKGQVFHRSDTGYKFYEKPENGFKVGTCRHGVHNRFFLGSEEKQNNLIPESERKIRAKKIADNMFRRELHKVIGVDLRTPDTEDSQALAKIHRTILKGHLTISVAGEKQVKGTGQKQNSFDTLVDTAIKTIKSNNTHDSYTGRTEYAKHIDLLEQYLEAGKEAQGRLRPRVAATLKILSSNNHINSNISKIETRRYLAAKIFKTGGSVNSNLLDDVKGIISGRSYLVVHNKPFKHLLGRFITNPQSVGYEFKDGTFKIFDLEDPDKYVSIRDDKVVSDKNVFMHSHVKVGPGFLIEHPDHMEPTQDLAHKVNNTNSNILMEYFEAQRKFLEQFISSRVKG